MALRLCRSRSTVIVYNRSPRPLEILRSYGATVAPTPDALFALCDTIILMLADDDATDAVLGRGRIEFSHRVQGRLIINMGTHRPAYSQMLEAEIRAAGGDFVEAPVSGSRPSAEAGTLVAMLAGDSKTVERAALLLKPMCREIMRAGEVPMALATKMAVNLYLVTTVAALAEAANLALRLGLNLDSFNSVIASGQLRSEVAAAKLAKIVQHDFSPQASIRDVCKNAALIAGTAAEANTPSPMLDQARRLFDMVHASGSGALDMAAVVSAFAVMDEDPTTLAVRDPDRHTSKDGTPLLPAET